MNKETIKYFDIVLSKIENFEEFSSGVILFKILEPNEKIQQEVIEFNDLVGRVNLFGRNEDFFMKNGENGHHSLKPEGKIAKKLGSYSEYLKYIEKKELKDENKNINVNGVYIEKNSNKKIQSFENIANKKQVKAEPSIKPEQKSLVKKIFSSSWTLLFVGILVE
jgi:hypothetical protein